MTRERFIELVTSEQEPLRRFLLVLNGGNRPMAEDIAQDALVKAYLASEQFDGRHKFRTWLFTIAYRTFLDTLRHPHPIPQPLDENLAGGTPADAAFRHESLYRAIALLPEKSRAAIILYHLDGYSIADIATITGSNPIAVRQRLSRGLKLLKTILEQ